MITSRRISLCALCVIDNQDIDRLLRGFHFESQLQLNGGEDVKCARTRGDLIGLGGERGESHGAEVATKTIVLGALMAPVFPIAPLALMSGFKRGESAVLPEGKRYVVYVKSDTVVKVSAEH